MSHDVFISYSTKDKTTADAVCAKLEESKIRAWIAPRDVPAGSNFAESIINAINTCKVFILIWSANTNTSEHILTELNQAFDQGITIIPFRIQDVQPTSALRYYIGRTHWLDAMSPPLEKHIVTLIGIVKANLEQRKMEIPLIPSIENQKIDETKLPSDKLPELKTQSEKTGSKDKKYTRPVKGSSKRWIIPLAIVIFLLLGTIGVFLSGLYKRIPFIYPDAEEQKINASLSTPSPTLLPTYTATSNPPITLILTSTPIVLTSNVLDNLYPFDTTIKSHRYLFVKNGLTQSAAVKYCESINGHLVSIDSNEENEFIYGLNPGGDTWLGGSDEIEEGKWVWATGNPMVYQNWEKGQPDNNLLEGDEDCLDYFHGGSTWNDVVCLLEISFICEWDDQE